MTVLLRSLPFLSLPPTPGNERGTDEQGILIAQFRRKGKGRFTGLPLEMQSFDISWAEYLEKSTCSNPEKGQNYPKLS